MASSTYPPVSQGDLDGMSLHETRIYPCIDETGAVACYRRVTKVPNGWLYGEEFVPEKPDCTLDCTQLGE